MLITSSPTRIDLAGGTLDIFPLYLFEEGGLTVNMAVNIKSIVQIQKIPWRKIVLESKDLGICLESENAGELPLGAGLDLLARVVHFFNPAPGLKITTTSNAPPGGGLGASSSLLMSLMFSLNKITGKGYTPEEIIDYGANLEAQTIRVPTGKQDYYAAVFGGINALFFRVDGIERKKIIPSEGFIQYLEKGLILTFTG
ncbi:MAG: hypothetical protein J7M18_04990, partial [Candidatus Eremiobacteraeota bacterium]|nr:hypothetical protein [Candidatus Eremiobacteraeota bacterium]